MLSTGVATGFGFTSNYKFGNKKRRLAAFIVLFNSIVDGFNFIKKLQIQEQEQKTGTDPKTVSSGHTYPLAVLSMLTFYSYF